MNRRMSAKQSAQEVRETAWGDRGIPIDPVTIARALGVEVLEGQMPDSVSGAIIKEAGDDATIFIEQSDSDNRKRFTVAHELGHYVSKADEGDEDFEYVDYRGALAASGTNAEEIFANQFAAELLMPEKEVRKAWREHNSVSVLALDFGVSSDAMSFRLKNLGILE